MAGASPREPTIHIVTETDNGRTLQAQVGDVIHLRLSENPITGYRWTLLAAAQSVLSLRDDDFQPSVTGGTGSGGERHFSGDQFGKCPTGDRAEARMGALFCGPEALSVDGDD